MHTWNKGKRPHGCFGLQYFMYFSVQTITKLGPASLISDSYVPHICEVREIILFKDSFSNSHHVLNCKTGEITL